MKKQIFIIVLLSMAIFANLNKSYAQTAVRGSAPRGISCVDTPMNPMAGKRYVYKAASNQAGNYTFWATKNMNFITTVANVTTTNMAASKLSTPTELLYASTNYATSNALDTVGITWSDAVLSGTTTAAPTFVVVNQDGTCANNLKVWSITPIKAFTVDIRSMENATVAPLAYGATDDQCFDQVRGATYDAATSKIQYNFGTQVLYFEVIAANFTNFWTPTFTLTGLGTGQTAVIQWDYNKTFNSGAAGAPYTVTSGTPSATTVKTSLTATTLGASIFVKVTITNNTYEGINSTSISLAVDGVNSVNEWDIENNTLVAAGPLCGAGALNDKMDVATQILNPRPTVTPVGPSTPFVGSNLTN